MTSVELPASLGDILEKYNQAHLVTDWDQLSDGNRLDLLQTLQGIDFPEVSRLIDKATKSTSGNQSAASKSISPLQRAVRMPETEAEHEVWKQSRLKGEEILDAGQVGAILVAGGQGSRLGFPHPKGMYPIGPVTDRTLFQIFFEQLIALSNRHNHSIPYFIMTSDATHDETEKFLQDHNWFGFPANDLFLFRQGKLPAVDAVSGRILQSSPGEIAMSPDGHGGMLNALDKAGLIDEMHKRGIEYLYYHQVDNPSARLCDPSMLGFHVNEQAELSTKVVSKRSPTEKVGIVAEVDGSQQIIEYSSLDKNLSAQKDESGRLAFWAGNIAVHIFNRSLLERLTQADKKLPVHVAHKKVEYLDERGEQVSPQTPNAYKFEQFIFDAIPEATNPLVIEADRAVEFNPVKNASGEDSPETSRIALSQQAQSWLQLAQVEVSPNAIVEISPLVALEAKDLQSQPFKIQQDGDEVLVVPEMDDDE